MTAKFFFVRQANRFVQFAIRRGSGADKADELEEIAYEGYAAGGVALYIEVLTDNRNRALSEIRYVLNRGNGAMGESGSVAWQFDPKGYIVLNTEGKDQDDQNYEKISSGDIP